MKSYSTLLKRRAVRRAVILFFLTLIARTVAAAQEGEGAARQGAAGGVAARAKKEGRASVRGRVTFGDTGKPVRRGVVMLLTDLNHPALKRALTDRRGEFRFRGVPKGEYLLSAVAPGTVSLASGFSMQDTGFGLVGMEKSLGRVTVGEDGEAKVEFSVERGGAISGHVTYSDGEPATGAHLVLYVRKGGALTRFFTDPVRTNDRGAYRVEGLPPGEYVVGVIEKGAGGGRLFPRTEGSGLAARYHPSAASAKEAAPVRVEAGGEAEEVDVRLAENELRRLAGTVRWRRNGGPARRAVVMLRRRDDPAVELSVTDFFESITARDVNKDDTMMRDLTLFTMMSSNAPYVEADESGRWSFEDVPPGVYLLTVSAPLPPPDKADKPKDVKGEGAESDLDLSRPERPRAHRRVLVTLGSGDINDHRIELTEGGRVSGALTVDGGRPSFAVGVSAAASVTGAEALLDLPKWTKPDGTFLLEAVTPGEVYIDVKLPRGSRHYVRSITANGADLTREPLRVVEGAEAAGVLIDLGSDVAQLTGRALNPDDRAPTAAAVVLLVAADESLWQSKTSRVFARADAAGEFTAEAAPGDYLLFAWRPGDEPAGSPEAYVRSRAATARRVSLKPGVNPRIELTAARGEKQK